MIRTLKVLFLGFIVLFTLALINPAKAMYITTIGGSYAYIAVLTTGTAIISLANKLRS